MKYVIDSSSLIKAFGNFQESRFPSFWKKFELFVKEQKIVSVREVLREIEDNGDRLSKWAINKKKDFFLEPQIDELEFVQEIFQNRHYQRLIKQRQMISSAPVADPFIIAKAKSIEGCVITEDGFYRDGRVKKGGPSPASICKDFGIACVNLDGFMEREGWEF